MNLPTEFDVSINALGLRIFALARPCSIVDAQGRACDSYKIQAPVNRQRVDRRAKLTNHELKNWVLGE